MNDASSSSVVAVGDDRRFLRATPCECGELPMLIDGVYVCTCPACPCYDGEAWDGMEEAFTAVS